MYKFLPSSSPRLSLSICLLLGFAVYERLSVTRSNADIGKDLLGSEFDGGDVGRLVGDLLLEFLGHICQRCTRQLCGVVPGVNPYQVVVNTLVELPLSRAALPKLLVAVVKALPVLAELGEAVCVDVLDPRVAVSIPSTK